MSEEDDAERRNGAELVYNYKNAAMALTTSARKRKAKDDDPDEYEGKSPSHLKQSVNAYVLGLFRMVD